MNEQNDTKLKTFLQRYRPMPPEASQREFNAIITKIDADVHRRQRRVSFWWRLAIPVTVAACLTLFVVADFVKERESNVTSIDDTALEDFLYESYAVIDNGNSDLSVGDEWLQLAL